MVKAERNRAAPERLTYVQTGNASRPRRRKKQQTWEVEKILKTKTVKGAQKFQLRWKGFNASHDSWEPAGNCACDRLMKQFLKQNKKCTRAPAARKASKKTDPKKRSIGTAPKKKKTTKKKSGPKLVLSTDVDEHATVDTGAAVLQEGLCAWSSMLKCIDMSQNMDKFYLLQVLYKGDTAWFFSRWGRSGTNGQMDCSRMSLESAKKAFEKKFKEKTQFDWADGKGQNQGRGRPGQYCPITVAASEDGNGEWEFYQDNHLDGKSPGWYPYAVAAVPTVEGVYVDWKNNPGEGLNVRCVQSGHFSYRIDFDKMAQTNLSTHRERPIRRK